MRKSLFHRVNFLTVLFSLVSVVLFAQKINTEKSSVKFEIGGLVWSTVEGEIKGMSGSLIFDKNNLSLSFFNVCIDPKTIFTDDEKRDTHLKEPDFFNTLKHTNICFKSTNVTKSKDSFHVIGKLTLLGITKSIEFDFKSINESGVLVLGGELEINRFDFGLAAESYSSTMMVGKEVIIKIRCVFLD